MSYRDEDQAAHVAEEVRSYLRVHRQCSGCAINLWTGELLSLTIEDAEDEPYELTFHSRQCLMDWLTADAIEAESEAHNA